VYLNSFWDSADERNAKRKQDGAKFGTRTELWKGSHASRQSRVKSGPWSTNQGWKHYGWSQLLLFIDAMKGV
jgi:hypothetical protein